MSAKSLHLSFFLFLATDLKAFAPILEKAAIAAPDVSGMPPDASPATNAANASQVFSSQNNSVIKD